ncbi:MAG: hypothetical protein PHS41_06340, partial [Victivallaceae bacterium]|nr:hypothetical protein [Victivallaceae bacterium]
IMTNHNGASVDNDRRVALTLVLGMNFTYYLPRRDDFAKWAYLGWVDALQKGVASEYTGARLHSFEHLPGRNGQTGLLRARYGQVEVIANLQSHMVQEGKYRIAPFGFLVRGKQRTAGSLAGFGAAAGRSVFLAEPGKISLFGRPGAEFFLPAELVPSGRLFLSGEEVAMRREGEVFRFQLPSGGTQPQVERLFQGSEIAHP